MPDAESTTVGPCADETVVVPPATVAAPELAWSQDADEPEFEAPPSFWSRLAWGRSTAPVPSWRLAFGYAAMLLAVGLLIAVGVSAWPRHRDTDGPVLQGGIMEPGPLPAASLPPIAPPSPDLKILDPAPAAEPTVTVTPAPPSTVTVEAAPPPAPTVAPPPADADRIFREGASGIPQLRIVNWDVAEAGARGICGGFAKGMTRAQILDEVQRNDPTFLPWQSSAIINVSLAAYCPQYEGN
ncbi:hypothetical protein AWC11_07430 [Mycobacterium interjectum]|nr:hypothetical protein AWC11_07430 [Mycobacterium interjectum]